MMILNVLCIFALLGIPNTFAKPQTHPAHPIVVPTTNQVTTAEPANAGATNNKLTTDGWTTEHVFFELPDSTPSSDLTELFKTIDPIFATTAPIIESTMKPEPFVTETIFFELPDNASSAEPKEILRTTDPIFATIAPIIETTKDPEPVYKFSSAIRCELGNQWCYRVIIGELNKGKLFMIRRKNVDKKFAETPGVNVMATHLPRCTNNTIATIRLDTTLPPFISKKTPLVMQNTIIHTCSTQEEKESLWFYESEFFELDPSVSTDFHFKANLSTDKNTALHNNHLKLDDKEMQHVVAPVILV